MLNVDSFQSASHCSITRNTLLHQSAVCLTTRQQPLPKPVLQRMRSITPSFSFQYPLASLSSTSICLSLLPRLPVTYMLTRFRRQFLRRMWAIQLVFLLFIVRRTLFSSLTLCNTSSPFIGSVQLIQSILLQHHISKLPRNFWSTIRVSKFQRYTNVTEIHFACTFLSFQKYVKDQFPYAAHSHFTILPI